MEGVQELVDRVLVVRFVFGMVTTPIRSLITDVLTGVLHVGRLRQR